MRAIDPVRSRVVLVGSPLYRDTLLPDVPQVGANITDLARVFTDPQLGGLPSRNCVTVPGEARVEDVGDLLREAAAQAEDTLLLYYAGHGLLGRNGELYLSLHDTRFRAPEYSALLFDTVRGTFVDSPAATRVVIVDSCYSGRAIGQTLGADDLKVIGQMEINGTYTLTSAPPNSLAIVRDGEAHTAFTERLLRLLNEGSPQAADLLTLSDIYRILHARMKADALPPPQQCGTATASLLGLVRNRQQAPPQAASEQAEHYRPPGDREAGRVQADAWLGSRYAQGRRAEQSQDWSGAVAHYEAIFSSVPGYLDVAARLNESVRRRHIAEDAVRRVKDTSGRIRLRESGRSVPAMAVAESSAEAMPKSGRRTSRGFPRHPHQYFWIGLACVIAAIANGASQQLTSLGTNPQVVLTWVSGLLAVGAIVAFGLSLRHGWLFSRPVRQYLWFSIACGLSFIAGLVAYQFTLPRTQLQFAVGWAILLSGVAGLLSASLARRSRKTGS